MPIRAISQATSTNKIQNQPKSNQVKTTPVQTSNAYQLPSYKVSFGMARIDVQKLKEETNTKDKYFKTDESGNIPARNMEADELKETVDTLHNEVNAVYVFDLFKTKNPKTGQLIAHCPKEGVLKVMNESLLKYPNGKETIKKIYLTPDNSGYLPAHTFTRLEDYKEMARFFNENELKKIYTTETDEETLILPTESTAEDGVNAYIIGLFADDKDTLKEIFLHENNVDNEHPMLNGPKDAKAFLAAFQDDESTLENYFTEEVDGKRYNKHFMPNYADNDNAVEVLNEIHSQIIGVFPHLLKDIYTLPNSSQNYLKDIIHDNVKPQYAKNIMDLITNSDLSIKDSLEVLNVNKEFLKGQHIENLDLIENYLNTAMNKKQ